MHQLGCALFNRWKTSHGREDLDRAIDSYSDCWHGESTTLKYEEYLDMGAAFFARYSLDSNREDLDLAIYNLTLALDRIKKAGDERAAYFEILTGSRLASAYLRRYYLDRASSDLDKSISFSQKICDFLDRTHYSEINLNVDKYLYYYDLGVALYERWILKRDRRDEKKAKEALLSSLEESDLFHETYLVLRALFFTEGQVGDGNQCVNTALYLFLKGISKWQYQYSNIIDRIPPDQLYDKLKYMQLIQKRGGLDINEVEQFFPKMDFLFLLQYMCPNMQVENRVRTIPVLLFYLGGLVSSYIIFDDDIDQDTSLKMTPREQYYYVRSAMCFYDHTNKLFSADSILDFSISSILERNRMSSEEWYYLGQLYYLRALSSNNKGDLENASHAFFRSNSIWAKAMLAVINDSNTDISRISAYILSHCNQVYTISSNISDGPFFLDQFKDYFHFNEVHFACPEFFTRDCRIGPDLMFFRPIWEVFHLSQMELVSITTGLRRSIGEAILKEKAHELAITVESVGHVECERIQREVSLFSNDKTCEEVENRAQSFIRDTQMDRKDVVILLRYLFKAQKIDENQYFALVKYNEYCGSSKKANHVLSVAGTLIGPAASYLLKDGGFFGMITDIIVLALTSKLVTVDSYDDLKSNLWAIMNNKYLNEDTILFPY
jgi:hypothetical protein